MELSTFATITGMLALVAGLPILVASGATIAFFLHLVHNDTYMRTAGAVIIVLTVLTLQGSYRIGTDAAGLIRLVAWIGLIKGFLAAWFPRLLMYKTERIFEVVAMRPFWGAFAVVVGGLLLYGAQLV
ncbi:hypothetical protein COU80_03840 [Candidatus Peregrinibacteria bacterium CG10_big_fil_rev_8_21_14_0_10_55_24]|nr:MAG: hypothetical protein COU80_03840 [Candidatus Peregrinibacteria bacterium CG10_big_fil_rev_8_21_14_0_10_55_24]